MTSLQLVLPALKISGGVLEALRMAKDLQHESDIDVITMWNSTHPVLGHGLPVHALSRWENRVTWAFFQLPFIMLQFARLHFNKSREFPKQKNCWMFTHFSTLPLSWVIPSKERYYFVQGLEWRFYTYSVLSRLLKSFIIMTYRQGTVITANRYLSEEMAKEGITVAEEFNIWADANYEVLEQNVVRDVDLVMVLRKGMAKRLDLYLKLIQRLNEYSSGLVIAIITPDNEIAESLPAHVRIVLVRPDIQSMSMLYARSKLFILLSQQEGFGLPPLEAMGAGCVPICRDSGGIRAYMTGELSDQILSLDTSIDEICVKIKKQLNDTKGLEKLSQAARIIFKNGLNITQERTTRLSHLLNH